MRRSSLTVVFALLAASSLTLLAGCRAESPETPVGAYLTFHKALRQGNLDLAWSFLSSSTQKVIEERTRAVAAVSGGSLELKPSLVTFANVPRPPEVTEVSIVQEQGEQAVIQVGRGDAGSPGAEQSRVSLVKEGGTWKIDLTKQLETKT